MPLITTIQQVKQVLKISNLNNTSTLPDIESAEEKYIIPKIGKVLYNELLTAYEGNTLTTIQKALLLKVQKPLAAFAYFDGLAIQHAMITDTGVRKINTDTMPTAYRWEFDGVKDSLANMGHQGMESLLQFLEDNSASFPSWTSSEAYAIRNKFLIKTALDFSDQYRIDQPHRTYSSLLSVMADVEDLYIKPTIGEAFFAELKADPAPTADEKQVIATLKKAIAQLCIHHSLEKSLVKITEAGVTVYDRSSDRADSTASQPTHDQIQFVLNATKRDGQSYLVKAKTYLDQKASGSVFATYFGSSFYSAPKEYEDPNKSRKIFRF
jgi:hypothetical protein